MINRNVVVRYGAPLILASATVIGGLKVWEGGDDGKVYADKLAGGIATGCYGVTQGSSEFPLIIGDVWSSERCEWVLEKNAKTYQMGILDCLSVPLTQNQFDALSIFAYNVGVTGACASRAFGLIDNKQYMEGCRAIAYSPGGSPVWSYAGKPAKFVQGLHNRRKWEMNLCLDPVARAE